VQNPFAKKTVDSVVATFIQAVTDLREIGNAKDAERDEIAGKIVGLELDKAAAASERNRAYTIASKIEALLS
jgi:hypothetical protein